MKEQPTIRLTKSDAIISRILFWACIAVFAASLALLAAGVLFHTWKVPEGARVAIQVVSLVVIASQVAHSRQMRRRQEDRAGIEPLGLNRRSQ
jgi:hypothetical protein